MSLTDDNPASRPRADLLDHWTTADGTELIIRPLNTDDAERELRFIESLSPQSLYDRTFSSRTRLQPGELDRLVRFNVQQEIALVAAIPGDAEETFVAVARLARSPDGDFEFAIVVRDDWQRRGVATRLLRTLLDAARHAGIARVVGLTLATNMAMQNLARRLGFAIGSDPDDGTVAVLSMDL